LSSEGILEARSALDAARDAYQFLLTEHPEVLSAADSSIWLERAVTVLTANIASGRLDSGTRYEQESSRTLSNLAKQILERLTAEWDRIEGLRMGDSQSWTEVLQHLEQKAYFWLGPTGREEWARCEAREVASRTCADLWQWLQRHSFPFDVPFDLWSGRALRNRLIDSVRSLRRQARFVVGSLDHPAFEDERLGAERLPVTDLSAWLDLEAKRELLREASARLDERQARIIHLWYEEGWSADQIAAETGLTANHVYVLKHRAIKKLREYCAGA
jgi:RNA polymerase sigma factor (sigma-70 family)